MRVEQICAKYRQIHEQFRAQKLQLVEKVEALKQQLKESLNENKKMRKSQVLLDSSSNSQQSMAEYSTVWNTTIQGEGQVTPRLGMANTGPLDDEPEGPNARRTQIPLAEWDDNELRMPTESLLDLSANLFASVHADPSVCSQYQTHPPQQYSSQLQAPSQVTQALVQQKQAIHDQQLASFHHTQHPTMTINDPAPPSYTTQQRLQPQHPLTQSTLLQPCLQNASNASMQQQSNSLVQPQGQAMSQTNNQTTIPQIAQIQSPQNASNVEASEIANGLHRVANSQLLGPDPPKYQGRFDTRSFSSWEREMKKFFRERDVPENIKASIMMQKALKGEARAVAEALPFEQRSDASIIVSHLREHFSTAQDVSHLQIQFDNLKQRQGDSAYQWSSMVERLARQAYPDLPQEALNQMIFRRFKSRTALRPMTTTLAYALNFSFSLFPFITSYSIITSTSYLIISLP